MVSIQRKHTHPSLANQPLLKNGLFVRRPLSNFILRCCNWLVRNKKQSSKIPKAPKKILLCNIANFGDVVIATTVLPHIKAQYPDCEIGFMTSSASSIVLANHPFVSHIHTFDHWYLHRHLGICKAALQHVRSKKQALTELKRHAYDLAIDLYSYFPNTIPLLAKSQIPVRIGYTTGGFSNLLTHPMKWDFSDRYIGYAHLNLLTSLKIDITSASPLPDYKQKSSTLQHIIVHMGSSNQAKEWETGKWILLIQRLQEQGHEVILTGKGKREAKLCDLVAKATSATNWSNRLSWKEFTLAIQQAKLLISVDSVATHIAAAGLTPTVILFSATNLPEMWVPPSPSCKIVITPQSKTADNRTITSIEEVYCCAASLL